MTVVNPYLTFSDKCEEAFEFYRAAFGGEFAAKMTFADMSGDMPIADHEKGKIMHVALPIGNTVLMGSDNMESMGSINNGNNFGIAIAPDSKDEADRLYNALSAGGQQIMPMADAPWGDYFGMFIDKYGFQWMVNFREQQG